jgi:5'-nucleotidase
LYSSPAATEIFTLARELPRGTLQAIVAGHTHGTVAHFVGDVPIISVPNFGGQFGRLDLELDTERREVAAVHIHEPQNICARVQPEPREGECAAAPAGIVAGYEGRPVTPSAAVAAALEPERARVRALRAEPLGAVADAPFARGDGLDAPLGNLFAEALLAAVPDADVALGYGAGRGGLRADLAEGELTFGDAYDTFPFDNRITRATLTAAQLERVIAAQLPLWIDGRRGLPGLAGLRVTIACTDTHPEVRLLRQSGDTVGSDEPLVVAMASNTVGRFAATALPGEPEIATAELPILVRDAVAGLMLERRRLDPADFAGRWRLPPQGTDCLAPSD